MTSKEALERLHVLDAERMYLSRAAAVLQWDEETCLPPGGVEDRAEQLAVVEGLAHEKLVAPEVGELLETLGEPDTSGPGADLEADFLRVFRRDYVRAVKLPLDFVRECARAAGLSQAAWAAARKNNDFAAFAPHLEKMAELSRQKAACWGYGPGGAGSVYDGLLDFHEPGMGEAETGAVFGPLREKLSALLRSVTGRQEAPAEFLRQVYPVSQQQAFCRTLMTGLGFDHRRGRLDISAHPFTTTLGFNDVRITTRYHERYPLSGIFSVIHESGHAFYEMGVDPALRSTCMAEGVSMGIHESQSRLWENVIGRSRAFWEGWFPVYRDQFPEQLAGVGPDRFYRAINAAAPGLIRIEADELSYSLHIILRFELEQRLFNGTLTVKELPGAWNEAMKDFLGIVPETDAQGVLQDVHWSMGSFGYFPSYALGNLYGLQFWKALIKDLPDTEAALARRDYSAVHTWLREKIYVWGRRLAPGELLRRVTGEALSAGPFLEYIEAKYTELYGLY